VCLSLLTVGQAFGDDADKVPSGDMKIENGATGPVTNAHNIVNKSTL
jgi:hypothetical protein